MSDSQVAITRLTRGTQGSLSKATRQAVPPFLQKLYEMVSDSATDNLIRWSDNGDSFFVLDHERVAHDVLPRWFKHSNFASFVRQLNMYGFHKIPHLQQGVLKSDTETEIWNFEHPNFRRGQPDLLCLITRKKQAQERQGDDIPLSEKDGAGPGLVGGFPAGSLVDINSIISGITAIKRHQATISADLNDLKSSNQHLWQEALDARERHQKQQDTINRILKFLAGVFGNAAGHKGSPVHPSPHAGIPRKRQRLMIEDSAQSLKDKVLEPLDGEEPTIEPEHDEPTPTNRFVEMSPSLGPSKASSVVPETPDTQTPVQPFLSQPGGMTADVLMGGNFTNQEPFIPYSNSFAVDDQTALSHPYNRPNDLNPPRTLTPGSAGPSQELLQTIANSPGQLQRLLNLLNMQQQQSIPLPPPLDLNDSNMDHSKNDYDNDVFESYTQPQYPSSSDPTLTVPNNFDIVEPDSQTMSLLHTDDMPGISFEPYIENAQKLKKTSDAASMINEHVNMMDSNIDSLIKHLGLDPQHLESIRDGSDFSNGDGENDTDALFAHDKADASVHSNPNSAVSPTTVSSNPLNAHNGLGKDAGPTESTNLHFQPTIPDFDFNLFINELARQNGENAISPGTMTAFGDYNKPVDALDTFIDSSKLPSDPSTSPKLSAFVDEIASQSGQSDISSPPMTRAGLPLPNDMTNSPNGAVSSVDQSQKIGRKRKSDVEPQVAVTERANMKPKRKR